MITALIIIGLIALAFCIFIFVASIYAEKWYRHYTSPEHIKMWDVSKEKPAPSDGWYVLTALAAFVGISILGWVPLLMPIFAFIALLMMCKIKSGESSCIARFTIWTVILGSGALIAMSLALVILGFSTTLPPLEAKMPLNELQAGKKATPLAKLLDMVRGTQNVVSGGVAKT